MAARHADEIARATRGWTRGGLVSSELKKLPDVLRESEKLVNLDRAQQSGRTGLLAVTDERLVFLNARPLRGLEVEGYDYYELREVRMETPLLGFGNKLVLELATDRLTFSGLDRGRAERIAEWVGPRVGKKGPVHVPGERPRGDLVAELKASLGKFQAVAATTALPGIADELGRGEEIGPALVGSLGSAPGVLVATDRRLLFATVDPRRPVQEWRYADIEAIDVVTTVKWFTLAIQAAEPVSVTTTSNARADAVAGHVRPRLEAPKPKPKRDEEAKPDAPALPIDVNTANHAALTGRLGLTEDQARRAIEIRDERGAFASLDEFAGVLDLEPHEAIRVRTSAVAQPPARPPEVAQPEPARPGDFEVG